MATFDWPSVLTPRSVSWGITKAGVQFRSPMAGSIESVEFPGQFWTCSVTLPEFTLSEGGQAEAFFSRLAGGSDRVRVPYWRRLIPRGTLRGTPTLSLAAARGDLTLSIVANGGLLSGDMVGVAGQLFQCFSDCTPSAGILVVPLVNRVRSVLAAGSPVTWFQPTCTMLLPSMSNAAPAEPGRSLGLAIDLEEVPT
jgi:hypothetical protein